MKFVALALALLLAVGSQAASLQADATSQQEGAWSAVILILTQAKDCANKVLNQFDDTEYRELKTSVSQCLDDLHTQFKTLQGSISPMADSVVRTISDATAEFHTSNVADIDALIAGIEVAKLKEDVNKNIKEYRTLLDRITAEYETKQTEMDALRKKMEPVIEELRTKIATNVEETKTALMPIVEAVRAKLSERLENLKEMASPYVEEYKDQLKQAYSQAQSINTDEISALREKITPLAEDIKVKLQEIIEIIAAFITKN